MSNNLDFKDDAALLPLLKQVGVFKEMVDVDFNILIPFFKKVVFEEGETIVQEGKGSTSAYIVAEGECRFETMGRTIKILGPGEFFGEIAFIDSLGRVGTVRAKTRATLLRLKRSDLDSDVLTDSGVALKIYKGYSRQVASYIKEGAALFNEMDVLLIQDGGCAPGYNSVTAFISEHLGKSGRKVFVAGQGFRSIVSNRTEDYSCLIHDRNLFNHLDHIPGVVFSPVLRESAGAAFRSERYREFVDLETQKIAVENILSRNIKVLVGIGGNGTFAGMKALSELLPPEVQVFFIPVTIDSDISGTECIGENTGVEFGSEKIRCYMADARTHNRCYIIEMMGAQGGFHALYSCLGAGAHLAVLPSSDFDTKKVAGIMNERTETVIVVAEGYKARERKESGAKGNAAEYFRDELVAAGLDTNQKIVCEGFSRDIRGAVPNNMDLMLAQRMSRKLCNLIKEGNTREMPAVLSGKEYSISFDDIRTDNSVESDLASLANRL
jgi:6-phosphofructokinase 1